MAKGRICAGKDFARDKWFILNPAKLTQQEWDELEGADIATYPDKAKKVLSTEEVVVLLKVVANTDLINTILVDRVYDRDIANRHLDIMEKLIQKIK